MTAFAIYFSFSLFYFHNINSSSSKSTNLLVMNSYGARYYSKAPRQKTKKAKNLAWSHRAGRSQSQDFRPQLLISIPVKFKLKCEVLPSQMYFSLNSICLRKGHLSHLFLINWSFVTLLKIGISHTPQILPWYIVLGCKTFWCTVQKRGNVVKTNILLSLECLDCKVGPWLSCEN